MSSECVSGDVMQIHWRFFFFLTNFSQLASVCHAERLFWAWVDGVIVHDSQTRVDPEKLSKVDVLSFIHHNHHPWNSKVSVRQSRMHILKCMKDRNCSKKSNNSIFFSQLESLIAGSGEWLVRLQRSSRYILFTISPCFSPTSKWLW